MRDFLEEKYHLYNKPSFIETDPISIPRKFSRKQDIEIAGFLAATIAWGQRPTILKNANDILRRMDQSPYDFIRHFERTDLNRFKGFVHRTFNSDDLIFFFKSLQRIYTTYPSLEDLLIKFVLPNSTDLGSAITQWRSEFFLPKHLPRSEKHFSNPATGSACKRINMFLRWMVRKDEYGVDFGIWTRINPTLLTCPLDVHSGRVARKLGLLERKQDDWKAAIELTDRLKAFDPKDPVKYDFALFGLGVFEKF